jgi:hypothetical protein
MSFMDLISIETSHGFSPPPTPPKKILPLSDSRPTWTAKLDILPRPVHKKTMFSASLTLPVISHPISRGANVSFARERGMGRKCITVFPVHRCSENLTSKSLPTCQSSPRTSRFDKPGAHGSANASTDQAPWPGIPRAKVPLQPARF